MTALRIFEYGIPPINDLLIEMPRGSTVLGIQARCNAPMLLAEGDPSAPPIKRRFKMRGTGYDLPEDARHYVGSVVVKDGDYILHVYTDGVEYPLDHDFSRSRKASVPPDEELR